MVYIYNFLLLLSCSMWRKTYRYSSWS